MAFGQEMKDFIAAFQVGSQIQGKRRQQALDVEQEANRSREAANKEAAVESRYQRTLDYNQAGRDETTKRNAGIDLRAQEQLDLNRTAQDRLAMKEADAAWNAQIEADPEMGYDPAGNIIPPPSQRGAVKEAIPTTPTSGGIGTVSSSGMNDLVINPEIVADAIDGGLKKLSQEADAGGIQGVMEGAGAPLPQTVQAIDAIIDPDNQMTEDQKTLARMEATYEFYLTKYKGKDGVERANEAAAQWLQHARGVAAIQAHAAQVLNAKGDMVGAAKKLQEMHKSIPDGMSTTYNEAANTFTVTDDQTGEVLQEGEVTPELIDQVASSFTKGPEFFNVMKQAAMRSKNFNPGAGDKSAKEEKPVTSGDLKEKEALAAEGGREEIYTELVNLVSKELVDIDGAPIFGSPEEFMAQVGEDSANALADLAVMISGYNGIPASDAAKLALIIVDPDVNVGDPSEQHFDGFKVLPISAENKKAGKDIMVIKTPDGRELELPGNDATVAIRTANRGLFIAAKANIDKNVGMTNERVINENNQYNLQRQEDQRFQEEQRSGARTGRGYTTPVQPPKRTMRGGG